ncbi:MAG: SpoIIE family protein phosphatase [Bacteroidota bacterium]
MNLITKIQFVLFICIASQTIAQEGTPFITHFKESKNFETQNWSISQSNDNIMLFANRKGILTFDGQEWNTIKLPNIPFVVKKNPYDNKIYIGANNDYGILEKNNKGLFEYNSLVPDTSDIGVITKIEFTDSSIYFYGDQSITRHRLKNPEIFKRWYANDKPFSGIIITQKNTFFNVLGEGLYRLESDTLFPIVTGFYTKDNEILFSLPYNDKRVIVGTDDNELYTFDGIKYYNYEINDDGYLKESILSDAVAISDSLYAFATLYGGVEIVSKKTGKIVYTINYQNGLPDNEIYSFGLDNNNGLWLSHEFGISRVDFNLPIRNFTTYPGLEGNLISTLWHNNQLYVATNEGVFFLDEVKDFNEVEVYVKTKPRTAETTPVTETETSETEEKKPLKNLFSKLFNKKEDSDKDDKKDELQTKKPEAKKVTKQRYIKKTVSELKSINHIFKKIDGINEKCKQLVSTDNGILVASNTGLYHISDNKAEKIISNRNINHISQKTTDNKHYIATNSGVFQLILENNKWVLEYNLIDFNEIVHTVSVKNNQEIWLGGNDLAYLILLDSLGVPGSLKTFETQTDFPENYRLNVVNDTTFLFLESGIFYFQEKTDSFKAYKKEITSEQTKLRFLLTEQGTPWLYHNNTWKCLKTDKEWTDFEQSLLKLFDDIIAINIDQNNNLWIINDHAQIYKITHKAVSTIKPEFNVFFKKITNGKGLTFELSDLVFEPDNNAIYVNIIAPSYIKNQATQYQYFVEGLMIDWSSWSHDPNINLIVKPGEYKLHVRARDVLGNKSQIKTIDFTIKPPFTETIWFYILIALAIIILFYFILKAREKKLKHDKKVLEQKVKERTIEIQEQKEEIETQRDEIAIHRDKILRQNEDITDSINYASRIQNAMLPLKDQFEKTFNEHFIFYQPRDIVSGDFYWISEGQDKIYFAAADCTGHGVPGAFMSMLGISSLNEIIGSETNNLTAAKILNLLREKIKFSLHQTGKEGEAKDGMDIALCVLHKKKMVLEFAGAFNPLYHFRNGELNEYKADRMPIGIYHIEKKEFTNNEIEIKKGDTIYIFSDGYADQFGGPGQTKFKSANLKKMLTEIINQPMDKQKEILEERFNKWKGQLDQVDDIIMIGIRF